LKNVNQLDADPKERIESIYGGLLAKLVQTLPEGNLVGTAPFLEWVNYEMKMLERLSQQIERMSSEQLKVTNLLIDVESVCVEHKFRIFDMLQWTCCYFESGDGDLINDSFKNVSKMLDPMMERRPVTKSVLDEMHALEAYLQNGISRMLGYECEPLATDFRKAGWPDESKLRDAGFPQERRMKN